MIVKFRHGQEKQRKIDCTRRNFCSDAIETLSNPFQLNPNMLEIYGYSLVSLIQVNPYQPSSTIINHHQPSSTIINHHQPSSTIINPQNDLIKGDLAGRGSGSLFTCQRHL